MKNDIKEIIIQEEEVLAKIKELSKKISDDYKDKNLLVVGILKG